MDWMEDSFLQLLDSPEWKCHVGNFIDENCLIFDSEEENKLPYTDVHRDFKKMIDDLLKQYLKDFGITLDQLMEACSSSLATKHQDKFKYLLAIDDFLLFKSIMVKRNTELNTEAMALLKTSEDCNKKKSNETDSTDTLTSAADGHQKSMSRQTIQRSSQSGKMDEALENQGQRSGKIKVKYPLKSEHHNLEEAVLKSIADFEEMKDEEKQFEALMQRAMEESMKTFKEESQGSNSKNEATTQIAEEKPDGRSHLNAQKQKTAEVERNVVSQRRPEVIELRKKTNEQLEGKDQQGKMEKNSEIKEKTKSKTDADTQWLELASRTKNDIQEQPAKLRDKVRSREDDIKQREIYLRKQRDKIIEMKKKEREKQLSNPK